MKKWALRIGLFVGSPLLVLLVIELAWRMVGDPRIAANEAWLATRPDHFQLASRGMIQHDNDPKISFVLTPGFQAKVGGNQYVINSHGIRGEEFPTTKPVGTKRILILGDSYAFGFGVDEADTISTQLQRRLQPTSPNLQVLNMGVPGYQTGQEYHRLTRDGLRFSPDIVVLVYYANDNVKAVFRWDPRLRLTYVDELPLPLGLKNLMARSILYAKATKGYTATIDDQLNSRGPMGLKHNWPTTRIRLDAIHQLCKQSKVALVCVAIPALDTSAAFIDPSHDFNTDHNRVLAYLADLGLPTIDFRSSLLRWSLGSNTNLPSTAIQSPSTLRNHIAKQFNQPASKISATLMMQGLETLKVSPKPIENTFVGPVPPKKDSHLNPEGYSLIAKELAALIQERQLLR
jgi:hypothetical protein